MMHKRQEPTWYETPEGALIVPGAEGRHWVHLKSAEDLAKAMWECPDFDIRRLYQSGGVPDGLAKQPEGFVALRSDTGRLLVMGSFIVDGLQWPTSPAGENPIILRERFKTEISVLQQSASELLPCQARPVSIRM